MNMREKSERSSEPSKRKVHVEVKDVHNVTKHDFKGVRELVHFRAIFFEGGYVLQVLQRS